ncbi:MAG: 23S rRNA (pseudouridine(1915)-N(3))-methyltransferase RlmH [Bryobacteraceae bacterium]
MRVYLYFIGKVRDRNAHAIAEEYVKRTSRFVACEMREIDPRRTDLRTKHAGAMKVLLDPEGRSMNSKQFAELAKKTEEAARDLVFAIGGADGLPEAWRDQADLLLSLSQMTWPHGLARAMLAEQIYRAFTTLRGHPYPR